MVCCFGFGPCHHTRGDVVATPRSKIEPPFGAIQLKTADCFCVLCVAHATPLLLFSRPRGPDTKVLFFVFRWRTGSRKFFFRRRKFVCAPSRGDVTLIFFDNQRNRSFDHGGTRAGTSFFGDAFFQWKNAQPLIPEP